jgi:hypothetical protein
LHRCARAAPGVGYQPPFVELDAMWTDDDEVADDVLPTATDVLPTATDDVDVALAADAHPALARHVAIDAQGIEAHALSAFVSQPAGADELHCCEQSAAPPQEFCLLHTFMQAWAACDSCPVDVLAAPPLLQASSANVAASANGAA